MDEGMALLDYLWERHKEKKPSVSDDIIEERKELVNNDKAKLDQIYNWLLEKQLVTNKTLTKSNALSKIVNKEDGITFINRETIEDSQIAPKILEAYFLTEKILENLGLIKHVNYVFTYIDSKNNYYRTSNLDLLANPDAYYLEKRDGIYSLRLRESAMAMKIKEQNLKNQTDDINKHYQSFSQPYWDYSRTNKTGWKINKGVVSEAFERHWEQLGHSIEQTPFDNSTGDLGSIGYRWYLYRLSSGSDPYYTGPDTAESQVKNANASIVSNVDTVLNTIILVKTLIESRISLKEKEKIEENLNKLFNQSSIKPNIARKIWDGVDATTRAEIIESFGGIGTKLRKNAVIINT